MSAMTSAERTQLHQLIRTNARVARADIDHRAAQLMAEFEMQLATQYDPYARA